MFTGIGTCDDRHHAQNTHACVHQLVCIVPREGPIESCAYRYIRSCNPTYCDYNDEKPWYNYYLEILALVWGVFSSGRAALVLWSLGVWAAVHWFSCNGGDASDISKSLIEPEHLTWDIPQVI